MEDRNDIEVTWYEAPLSLEDAQVMFDAGRDPMSRMVMGEHDEMMGYEELWIVTIYEPKAAVWWDGISEKDQRTYCRLRDDDDD